MRWLLLAAAALFTLTASAADISGTWKGTADTPVGKIERTFVFKVNGNKLTGETTSQMTGTSQITDGKIDGDKVTFTLNMNVQGQDFKLTYTGKITGDEIAFHVESADGQLTLDYTVKKVS